MELPRLAQTGHGRLLDSFLIDGFQLFFDQHVMVVSISISTLFPIRQLGNLGFTPFKESLR